MNIDFTHANTRISDWAKKRVPELKQQINALGIQHVSRSPSKTASASMLKNTLRKKDGLINRIGYSIPRHMIYVHKGVGRGTKINQVGTTNRKAKPWYNPVIDKNIDELADIVAEEVGGAVINNLLIK
jgi:hypothetical protein